VSSPCTRDASWLGRHERPRGGSRPFARGRRPAPSDAARLPDPEVLGIGFVPGGAYDWAVSAVAAADLDAEAGLNGQIVIAFAYVFGAPVAGAVA